MKRKGVWKDVTCTYTLKFKNSEVSVPFKVDVYGEGLVLPYYLYNNPQFSVRLTGVWIGVLLTPFILVALDGPSGQFFTIIDNSNTSLLIRHYHSPLSKT